MVHRLTYLGLVLYLSLTGPAFADDIFDAINDAQKAYKAGDLSSAKQALDLASQLISQKNAEGLIKAFPAPLKGWKSEDADTRTGSFTAFTGSNVAKSYTNTNDDNVTINISADGPVLTQMISVLANPQIAGMMGKIVRIGDQRAIQERNGDITMLVANRFVIKIDGSAKADDKLAYAKAINFSFLQSFK